MNIIKSKRGTIPEVVWPVRLTGDSSRRMESGLPERRTLCPRYPRIRGSCVVEYSSTYKWLFSSFGTDALSTCNFSLSLSRSICFSLSLHLFLSSSLSLFLISSLLILILSFSGLVVVGITCVSLTPRIPMKYLEMKARVGYLWIYTSVDKSTPCYTFCTQDSGIRYVNLFDNLIIYRCPQSVTMNLPRWV